MKKQPWIILIALALSMLACSVVSGLGEQQVQDVADPTPEATQDLRKEYKQQTQMATMTDEPSPSEEEPERTSTSHPGPTDTPVPEEGPGPTNLALEIYQVEEDFALNVVDVNIETWEYGYLYVNGFLMNMESFSLYPKKIFMVIVDENGDEILSDFELFDIYMIPAGKKAPFRFSISQSEDVSEDAEGIVFGLEVEDESYSAYSWDLEVVNPEGKLKIKNFGGNEYEIEAEVINVSDEPIRYIHGRVALFDADGKLLTSWFADIFPQDLAPGETGSVEADVPHDYSVIDHFEFYLEGSINSE